MSTSPRPPWWLLALALAAFAVQTDDFIIVGVLPEIAADVAVSEAAAGQLVTVYSLVYALTAPLWALLLARLPCRRVLCGALVVFTLANAAVLGVDSYPALLALRVVAALAAAVVLPTALAVASTQAPPGQRGRYLALVMTGLTGAILVGIPLGTWIGALLGWRATFLFCGLLGLAALLLAARPLEGEHPGNASRSEGTYPSTGASRSEDGLAPESAPASDASPSLRLLVRPLFDRTVAVILAVTVLTVAGNLAFQTYLAVVLAGLAGVSPTQLGVLLVCSGIGGLAGTRYAGRLVDRHGAPRTFRAAGTVFCLTMTALALLWLADRPVPVWGVAPLLVVWSAAAWAVPPSLQALMLDRAGERAAGQAMAVHSSSVYVGAALGGTVGGAAVAVSPGMVPVAAAVAAGLGLLLIPLARRAPDRAEPARTG